MSEPLFPEPEPGQHPSQRGTPEGVHPWAPSALDLFDTIRRGDADCEHADYTSVRLDRGIRRKCQDCGMIIVVYSPEEIDHATS